MFVKLGIKIIITYTHKLNSKLFHKGKVFGVADTLDHFIAILYMLMKIFNSGVKDVRETVFSKILNSKDPIGFSKRILRLKP